MRPVVVRNIPIGEGRPKVCVPIVGKTTREILEDARQILALPADVVEWRADHYDDVWENDKLLDTARALREILGGKPILFTFRTANEGGERPIDADRYEELLGTMARSGLIDLIDVEIFMGDDTVRRIIADAHEQNVPIVASNHDFEKTPPQDEIVRRLCRMQDFGADILKIALMPRCRQDVLTLLAATLEMSERHTDRPLITMSMAGMGLVSRLTGECFGSALTFGAASKASAPGQIGAEELASVLDVIHTNL